MGGGRGGLQGEGAIYFPPREDRTTIPSPANLKKEKRLERKPGEKVAIETKFLIVLLFVASSVNFGIPEVWFWSRFPFPIEYQAPFGIWTKRSFAGVCRGASERWKKAKTSGEVSPKSLRQLPPQETWRCLLNIKIDCSLDVERKHLFQMAIESCFGKSRQNQLQINWGVLKS